jgi:hypothetical protein
VTANELPPIVLGFDDFPRPGPLAAERQLMLAVLADAVRSYLGNRGARDGESRALFRETLAWFASADQTTLFSFASICDALDIDPDYVRRMLVVQSLRHRRRRKRYGATG